MSLPTISIITVAWNASATIADTMRSVAAQWPPPLEHIVIDGGSTDGTPDIARSHGSARTVVRSEADDGLYDAMNKGFEQARGDYVGFLNADDFFTRTDAVSLLANAAARRPAAVSAGVAIVRAAAPFHWTRGYSATHFRPWMLRFGHMPPHPGFYARRDAALAVGRFDQSFRIGADFDWLVRFFDRHHATVIPETIVAVREGGASNSGIASRRTIAREAVSALRKNGRWTSPALVWAKYAAKAWQFAVAPHAYPAPPAVAWRPDVGSEA